MPPPGHLFDAELRSLAEPGFVRVRVRFDVRGLVIEHGNGIPLVWPYRSLSSQTALPVKGSSKVVLQSASQAGATLTIDDAQFVPSLLQSAPQLVGKGSERGASIPMVATIAGFMVAAGLLLWGFLAAFPYKSIARGIPEDTRAKIGELALSELSRGHKRCETPAGNAALMRLVDRLGKASGADVGFKVRVVDWSLVNAFAVMGNQIVLTRGLIQKATSPDEVAGVLGHEMGHSIEVHPEAAVMRSLGTMIGLQILLGGWTPDLITEAAGQLLTLRHSRENETEADEVALRILKSARIASGPFAGFFDKISKDDEKDKAKSGSYKLPDMFATHPPPKERAKRARAQADYPATPALDPADWEALRKICG